MEDLTVGRGRTAQTPLDQFLRLPEMKPALEFIDGRVIQKMSPMFPHSAIQTELVATLNGFARPRMLGRAFTELRSVFGGSSRVPDVSYYPADRVPEFSRGQIPTHHNLAPDITIEILSPGQTVAELRRKIRISLKHGTQLGWLIEPIPEKVGILRPGRKIEILKVGDVLEAESVLPGFSLELEVIFGWLDRL